MYKKSLILTLILIFSLNTCMVFAENDTKQSNRENAIAYNEAKIKNIQSAIIMNQNYIKELNTEASGIAKEIEEIDKYILEIEEELAVINQEIAENDNRIEEINAKKKKREQELLELKESYLEKRQALSKLSTQDTIEKINTKTELLKLMSSPINNTLKNTVSVEIEENTTTSLDTMTNNKKKTQKEQIELKQSLLQQQQSEKNNLLLAYYDEMAKSEDNIAYLKDTTETVKDAIIRLQSLGYEGNPNLIKGSGVLSYPCKTVKITSDYGMRIHPIYKVKKMHTGLDFGGQPAGTPVYASANGIVITAGWLNGYGYTVIIDHGNKVSTLYAHNSKLLVSPGDEVKRGQPIAKVGSTGNSTGPHIHFEVRVNGEHTDPKEWL